MDELDSGLGGPNAAPDVVVRRVGPEEWRELREIRLRALADAPYAFGATLDDESAFPDERWRERAARSEGATFVAEHAGRFVGCVSGGPAPAEGRVAGLFGMWVEPAARGTGIAGRLVEAVEDWARETGYDTIGLGVTTMNARAIAFYERIGFVDTGMRMPLREGGGEQIQIMARPLA